MNEKYLHIKHGMPYAKLEYRDAMPTGGCRGDYVLAPDGKWYEWSYHPIYGKEQWILFHPAQADAIDRLEPSKVKVVKEPPDIPPVIADPNACITDKCDDREPPDILTGTGSGKGATSNADNAVEDCPHAQCIEGKAFDACKIDGNKCYRGHTPHDWDWHDCNRRKGVNPDDIDEKIDNFCHNIEGRLKAQDRTIEGIDTAINDHDRRMFEIKKHMDGNDEWTHAMIKKATARLNEHGERIDKLEGCLDGLKREMSELSKQLGGYEASTIEVMREHEDGIKQVGNRVKDNEKRLDALNLKHDNLCSNYVNTMIEHERRIENNYRMEWRLDALAEINTAARLDALEVAVKDLQGRAAMPMDQAAAIMRYDEKEHAFKVKFHSGHGVVIARDLPGIECPNGEWMVNAAGKPIMIICNLAGKPCLHLLYEINKFQDCEIYKANNDKEPSAPGKSTWQGERCPFAGKDTGQDFIVCLLNGKTSCAPWFVNDREKWTTCDYLKSICPHYRPWKNQGSRILDGYCTCDSQQCDLTHARRWQDIDGKGTNCPRMLGRVKTKKNGDEKEKT